MHAGHFISKQLRLEQGLWALEPLRADGDNLPIGQLVLFLEAGVVVCGGELLLVVLRDEAELLLDVADDLELCRRGEGVAALHEQLGHPSGEVAAGEIDAEDSVRERVAS